MTIPSNARFDLNDIDLIIYDGGEINYIPDDTYANEGLIGFNFSTKEYIILGTNYAGEIKKGMLTYMMYKMPLLDCLSLHSSANVGKDNDVTLFFGLSGTGKTTLSTESKRLLIGDDEHVWCPEGIFNIEGGCYAKCKNLSYKNEPEIVNAIKTGSVLENVIVDEENKVDFNDTSITDNTRCSYPLDYLDKVKIPAYIDSNPKNIILFVL